MNQQLSQETKLKCAWTCWESYYQNPKETQIVWGDQTQNVLTFDSVKDFTDIYGHLPFGQPSECFFPLKGFPQQQITTVKVIQKSDPTKTEFKRVDGVYLFRKDIKPEYEDIKNLHGSIYKYEFNSNIPKKIIDTLWQNIAATLVSENIPHSDEINGVRMADKSHQNLIRIELWMKNEENFNPEVYQDIVSQITNIFYELDLNVQPPKYSQNWQSYQKENKSFKK